MLVSGHIQERTTSQTDGWQGFLKNIAEFGRISGLVTGNVDRNKISAKWSRVTPPANYLFRNGTVLVLSGKNGLERMLLSPGWNFSSDRWLACRRIIDKIFNAQSFTAY